MPDENVKIMHADVVSEDYSVCKYVHMHCTYSKMARIMKYVVYVSMYKCVYAPMQLVNVRFFAYLYLHRYLCFMYITV